MKLTYCLSSVALYFSVVVLVMIVDGQPTTDDDDIDKDEIAEVREELAKVKGELAEVKAELAEIRGERITPVGESTLLDNNTDTQTSAGKLSRFNYVLVRGQCNRFGIPLNLRVNFWPPLQMCSCQCYRKRKIDLAIVFC